jgi:hypothetical protein
METIIKMDLSSLGFGDVDWLQMSRNEFQSRILVIATGPAERRLDSREGVCFMESLTHTYIHTYIHILKREREWKVLIS